MPYKEKWVAEHAFISAEVYEYQARLAADSLPVMELLTSTQEQDCSYCAAVTRSDDTCPDQ